MRVLIGLRPFYFRQFLGNVSCNFFSKMSVNDYTSFGYYSNNYGRLGHLETLASHALLYSFLLNWPVFGSRGIDPFKHNRSIP